MTGASYSDDVFGEQPSAGLQGLHNTVGQGIMQWGRGVWHRLTASCKAERSSRGRRAWGRSNFVCGKRSGPAAAPKECRASHVPFSNPLGMTWLWPCLNLAPSALWLPTAGTPQDFNIKYSSWPGAGGKDASDYAAGAPACGRAVQVNMAGSPSPLDDLLPYPCLPTPLQLLRLLPWSYGMHLESPSWTVTSRPLR